MDGVNRGPVFILFIVVLSTAPEFFLASLVYVTVYVTTRYCACFGVRAK